MNELIRDIVYLLVGVSVLLVGMHFMSGGLKKIAGKGLKRFFKKTQHNPFLGMGIAFISFMVALVYLILKLCNWYNFDAGQAPILIGMFFLGAVQLIFLGIIGEYILSMNQRIMNRPLVVKQERINFDER